MLNILFTNDVRQMLDRFRRSVDQMFENFYGQALPTAPTRVESGPGPSAPCWSPVGTIIS
jgi:hypothetical protein